jgi:hypothetical protein
MGMAGSFSAGVGIMQRPPASAFPDPAPVRPSPRPYVLPLRYAEWVIRYCDETGAPVWVVARLFSWESGWNAAYRGKENDNGTHDLGLAALNSACLDDFRKYNDGAPVDPFDAETAIRVGVRYLAALHSATGSWRAAVGAYNVGLGAWRAGARPVRHMREVFGE